MVFVFASIFFKHYSINKQANAVFIGQREIFGSLKRLIFVVLYMFSWSTCFVSFARFPFNIVCFVCVCQCVYHFLCESESM